MGFTLACAQFSPDKANVASNLDGICQRVIQAADEGAQLVVFAETIVSGYFLEGGVAECALTAGALAEQVGERLAGLAAVVDVCLGFYESHGGNLYNSAAYLECNKGSCKVKHIYRKFFLPTYGVFDEERFVSRGKSLGVFDTRLGRVGILICEDVWHSILPTLCAVAGAQLILVPSASPARGFGEENIGNLERYGRMLRSISEEHGMYCANVQLCGFEGGKGFVGGSSVMNPFGRQVATSPIAADHLLLAEIDLDLCQIARAQLPLVSDLQSAWGDISRIAGSLNDC